MPVQLSKTLPSQPVLVVVRTSAGNIRFFVPRKELFRVHNIFNHHEYAFPLNLFVHRPLRVLDVGANIGLFAIYLKLIAANSVIHCFEPVPAAIGLLSRNTARFDNIHIHPYGLSDHEGRSAIHLHPYNSGENSIKRSYGSTDTSITIMLKSAGEMLKKIGWSEIDVLKIDTEGCEVEILESLKGFLPVTAVVLVEYHSETDRRRIDVLLSDHKLFGAKISAPDCGTLKYFKNTRYTQRPM